MGVWIRSNGWISVREDLPHRPSTQPRTSSLELAYLGDGVGLVVVGQGGGRWAVGGVGSVDLSNPGGVAEGSDGGHEGSGNGGVRELHLDGCC